MLEKKYVSINESWWRSRGVASVMIPQPVCFCLCDIVKLGQVPFSTLNSGKFHVLVGQQTFTTG